MPLHKDGDDFTVRQSVLQLVPYDQDERKTLPRLVRSRRRLGSLKEKQDPEQFKTQVTNGLSDTSLRQRKTYEGTTKFVKIPMLGGIEPLQMLLQSSCLHSKHKRSKQTQAKETELSHWIMPRRNDIQHKPQLVKRYRTCVIRHEATKLEKPLRHNLNYQSRISIST